MSSSNSSPTLSPLSTPPGSPLSSARAVSPTPTVLEPTSFCLPDLISLSPFPPTYHDNGDAIAAECLNWIVSFNPHFTPSKVAAMRGLQSGELTAYCYNNCPSSRLRVVADFLTFLFHLDDVSDGYLARDAEGLANLVMNALEWPDAFRPVRGQLDGVQPEENGASKLARDFWSRCVPDCAPAVQQRFKSNMHTYFHAVQQQASYRADGIIPDLETYIEMRRETSGCKPSFDLIEYSLDMELPDYVIEHPVIKALNQASNDLVTWTNDLFSYNVEQSRYDTHNMLCIFMAHDGLSLQQAADRVGEMCEQTMGRFLEDKKRVPSWGESIDRNVELYVNGLQEWVGGSLHWSFMSTRYFGDNGGTVKATRIVELLAKVKEVV